MAILSFCGNKYTVDHAVKGADYIHGYDAAGFMIVSFEGVSDFSHFAYDGEYMNPEMCEAEGCNEAILVNGSLRTKDGRVVNAELVGARPNTWTPSADDVGAVPASRKVNGKKLSSDITLSAADVGARPDTWTPTAAEVGATPASHAEDKDNPHGVTAEQVGAAPDGFGLGELRGKETKDCNDSIANGWYYSTGGAANAPDKGAFSMFVSAYSGYAVTQVAFLGNNFSSDSCIKIRKRTATRWGDWEWLNPPMIENVEYRTTERWNGKPVYAKLVVRTSEIDLVFNTSVAFAHDIINLDVSSARFEVTTFHTGYDVKDGASAAWVLPYHSIVTNENLFVSKITDTEIIVKAEGNANWDAGRKFYFNMKYCKTETAPLLLDGDGAVLSDGDGDILINQ